MLCICILRNSTEYKPRNKLASLGLSPILHLHAGVQATRINKKVTAFNRQSLIKLKKQNENKKEYDHHHQVQHQLDSKSLMIPHITCFL